MGTAGRPGRRDAARLTARGVLIMACGSCMQVAAAAGAGPVTAGTLYAQSGTPGEDVVPVQNMAVVRFILWCLVLLGCPAVTTAVALHPAWDLAAAASGIPLVSGSATVLLLTGTRRAAHARTTHVTLRQFLWAGVFASPFVIAVAASDLPRLRVIDYLGTALLVSCAAALTLQWWFGMRARQPVERTFYELRQRQAWNEHELGAIRRAVREAFRHADRDDPVPVDEHGKRRRHLRQVLPAVSDDTGPQRAVLGGAAL